MARMLVRETRTRATHQAMHHGVLNTVLSLHKSKPLLRELFVIHIQSLLKVSVVFDQRVQNGLALRFDKVFA